MQRKTLQLLIILAVLTTPLLQSNAPFLANSLPLSTRLRWVVDEVTGQRVKLHCVNWVGHMEPVLVEGLQLKPLDYIASAIASLGFNCVRLTWATHMFTKPLYTNLTVVQSLGSFGLAEAAAGVAEHNPSLASLTVHEAYDLVVDALGAVGLMVVLDNHVSRPQWCCGESDGNGFFGDAYFDVEEWLQGLAMVAQRYRSKSQVVGMSIRNELRGPLQSQEAWYMNVKRAARRIHQTNPNVLIIISGLNYGTDLSFLKTRPLSLKLHSKLVYEAHWYSFSEGKRHDWEQKPLGRLCAGSVRRFETKVGFVASDDVDAPKPLFVSEFGVDQRGVNRGDNRFLPCLLAYAVERDLDWAMWALQGSYYMRNGRAGFEETYGVLDAGWDGPRSSEFMQRFRLLHEMLQDPMSGNASSSHLILYHPLSGYCAKANNGSGRVVLGDCQNRSRWIYQGDGTPIRLLETDLCLRLAGRSGQWVILSSKCSDERSQWRAFPGSNLQLAATNALGRVQCLEMGSANSTGLFARECLCSEGVPCDQNPQVQWFKLVPSNVVLQEQEPSFG